MIIWRGTKSVIDRFSEIFPGVALCSAIAVFAIGIQAIEQQFFDHPYVEALVIAILVGMALRAVWEPGSRWRAGVAFSAKQVLEIAVVALGASVSLSVIVAVGPLLLSAIVATVILTLGFSFAIGRILGLPATTSILIACGNAICGNSAIAAVAPVIGASSNDVASSISFTAILGVLMVLGLPLLIPIMGLSASQYGILAGLTVYAVPQVLAATIPAGLVSTQVGTLVKLVRVLMLGPVVVGLSLFARRINRDHRATEEPTIVWLVPWFIVGFVLVAALRSINIIPEAAVAPLTKVTGILTIISMAGLGLGVDARVLGKVGSRITAAVTLSLILLLAMSLGLIKTLDGAAHVFGGS